MVKFSTITEANARFASDNENAGLVCVFAGATGGIGAGTIERLAVMLYSATFYILGRSRTRFETQRTKLQSLNPSLKIVFLEAEVSLISDIDAASKKILAAETKVDYLYMSPGCFPINVPQYTKENLDLCFALQYYSRMRLTMNLLPHLRNSPRPRILNVANGGNEKPILDTDIGLQDPANYSWSAAINHTTTLTTLALEYLANSENNKNVTFMHAFPGLVRTEIFSHVKAPETAGWVSWLLTAFMSGVAGWMQWIMGISISDSGTRQAWLLTGDGYEPGEMWRVDEHCEAVVKQGVLEEYREQGWRERVWEFTLGVFEKALAARE